MILRETEYEIPTQLDFVEADIAVGVKCGDPVVCSSRRATRVSQALQPQLPREAVGRQAYHDPESGLYFLYGGSGPYVPEFVAALSNGQWQVVKYGRQESVCSVYFEDDLARDAFGWALRQMQSGVLQCLPLANVLGRITKIVDIDDES